MAIQTGKKEKSESSQSENRDKTHYQTKERGFKKDCSTEGKKGHERIHPQVPPMIKKSKHCKNVKSPNSRSQTYKLSGRKIYQQDVKLLKGGRVRVGGAHLNGERL